MLVKVRLAVVGCLATIILICYADRTNIGIVLSDRGALSVKAGYRDLVFSAFYVGYMLCWL